MSFKAVERFSEGEYILPPSRFLEYIGVEDDDEALNVRDVHEAAVHGRTVNGFKLGYYEEILEPGVLEVIYWAKKDDQI